MYWLTCESMPTDIFICGDCCMICQRQCGWLQVQTQLTGRMALFEEKTGETLRLSAQVGQLTHQLNRKEQETAQAAASAAAAAAQVPLFQYVH